MMLRERLRKLYEHLRDHPQVFFDFIKDEDKYKHNNFVKQFDDLLDKNETHPYIRIGQHFCNNLICEDKSNIWQKDASWFIKNKYLKPEEVLMWGSYGKSGRDPIQFKYFCDLESDHIRNILRDGNIPVYHNQVFTQLLIDRENQ